ncbi:hypothetical protein L1887_17975 [Cichorium endivia]|nr:hypothetical protein L1887_17975 [Cichorium endivia]
MEQTRSGSMDVKGDSNVGNPTFRRFNFDYEDDSGNGVSDTCDSDEQEDEYNSRDDHNGDDCNSIHGDGRVPESSLVGNNVVENNSIDAEGLSKGEDEQPSNGLWRNDPTGHSESSFWSRNCNRNQHKRAISVKFKDIIRAYNQNKRKSKRSFDNGHEDISSSKGSHASLNTVELASIEITKTIDVGCSLGYQLRGADSVIRQAINGEGEARNTR